jgi:hypothetical protein
VCVYGTGIAHTTVRELESPPLTLQLRMKLLTCIVVLTIVSTAAEAFVTRTRFSSSQRELPMVGGRGWDNDNYLSGLSGDDGDREKATEEYHDFSKNRQAFLDRQTEIMNTPQGRAFLDARRGTVSQPNDDRNDRSSPNDPILQVKPGTGGGSRMAQMMAQAEQMKKMRKVNPMMGGFEQKFAVPLDDDDNVSEDGDNRPGLT